MNNSLNFTCSTEIAEIGSSYPQIQGLVPDSQDFMLTKNAKRTDFLSFNSDFFIVSPAVVRILTDFKIPSNKQLNCTVRQGDKKYPYVILSIFKNKYDFTDYGKSRFTLRFFKKMEKENVVFKTKEKFEAEAKQAYQIFTNIIYCDTKKQPGFDIFKVNKHQKDYFISERLRKAFIANNITGIDYLENVDTIFPASSGGEVIERYNRHEKHFLNRTSFFSNGVLCRKFNGEKNVIEEFNKNGRKERELIFNRGELKGSERIYFSNGNIKIEKLVKNNLEVGFKYYFNNGILNYEILHHGAKGVKCDKVYNVDGKELKGYGLKNGTGKIVHFNASGKGGREMFFRRHELVKEKKINHE